MSPLASALLAAAVWLAVVSSTAAGAGAKELGPGGGDSRPASAAAKGSGRMRRSARPPGGLIESRAQAALRCYSCNGTCRQSELKPTNCNPKYICYRQNLRDDKNVYDCADKDDVPESAYTCSTDLCNSAPGRALAPAPLATALLLLLRLLRGALV